MPLSRHSANAAFSVDILRRLFITMNNVNSATRKSFPALFIRFKVNRAGSAGDVLDIDRLKSALNARAPNRLANNVAIGNHASADTIKRTQKLKLIHVACIITCVIHLPNERSVIDTKTCPPRRITTSRVTSYLEGGSFGLTSIGMNYAGGLVALCCIHSQIDYRLATERYDILDTL